MALDKAETFHELEGIETPEFLNAKKDVEALILLAQKELGFKDIPEIKPYKEDADSIASYNRGNNTIYLRHDIYGDGNTYAEEITHYIRNILCPDTHELDEEFFDKQAVEEFFGRLGEEWFRKKTIGTDLERLFNNESTNWSDFLVLYENILHVKAEKRISTINHKTEKRDRKRLFRSLFTASETAHRVAKALMDGEITSDIAQILLITQYDLLKKEFKNIMDEGHLKASEFPINFIKDLVNLIHCVKGYNSTKNTELLKKRIEKYLSLLKQRIDFVREYKSNDSFEKMIISLNEGNQRWHQEGYVAAEIFANENTNFYEEFEELLREPYEDIYKNHIETPQVQSLLNRAEITATLMLYFYISILRLPKKIHQPVLEIVAKAKQSIKKIL